MAEQQPGADRFEVSRLIPATADEIFAILCSPQGHVDIDSTGMLMAATGEPAGAVGDTFVVHMDREALNDMPLDLYDVTVSVTAIDPPRSVEWTILSEFLDPPLGHVYGYRLEPTEGGTNVTSYYDWSGIADVYRERVSFPIIPEFSLRATLGILARTVAPGVPRPIPDRT